MPDGTRDSSAYAINDAGKVVGYFTDGTTNRHVVWDLSGGYSVLSELNGLSSVARDINNAGRAVGYASSLNYFAPIVWDESGNVSTLPLLPGGGFGQARAINNSGFIVGQSTDATGHGHPVLWIPIVPEPAGLLALGSGLLAVGIPWLRKRVSGSA